MQTRMHVRRGLFIDVWSIKGHLMWPRATRVHSCRLWTVWKSCRVQTDSKTRKVPRVAKSEYLPRNTKMAAD